LRTTSTLKKRSLALLDEIKQPICFVIQPFDNDGPFDKRYKETIEPALKDAKVHPLRGDDIPGIEQVIEKVAVGIEAATICVAEVSEDNPNVWYELGYAWAHDKPTILLCERSVRNNLPFDIQHRPVIFYRTDSISGYKELEEKLIEAVAHELERMPK